MLDVGYLYGASTKTSKAIDDPIDRVRTTMASADQEMGGWGGGGGRHLGQQPTVHPRNRGWVRMHLKLEDVICP